MSADPYRESSKRDAKLETLAAEGRHRIADAAASAAEADHAAEEKGRTRNLRAALGGYYGTPFARFSTALIVLCPVMFFGWVGLSLYQDQFLDRNSALWATLKPVQDFWWIAPVSALLLPIAIVLKVLVPPLASPARVAAEREWARSLQIGFDTDSYFAVLASESVSEQTLAIEVAWDSDMPAQDIIEGIAGMLDTGARVAPNGSTAVTIHTSPISGQTGVTVSSGGGAPSPVLRNYRVVAYVHDFVNKVLLPLHESSPIARVTFPRSA